MAASLPVTLTSWPLSSVHRRRRTRSSTRSRPSGAFNAFETNRPLVEALEREGGGWAREQVSALGAYTGDTETRELARLANEHEPVLRTHDRFGNRIDEVEFHPAWHELLGKAVEHEIPSFAWRHPEPGAQVARAALMMLCPESGVGCPVSMTYAIIPALRKAAGAGGGVGAAADDSGVRPTASSPRPRRPAPWPAWA